MFGSRAPRPIWCRAERARVRRRRLVSVCTYGWILCLPPQRRWPIHRSRVEVANKRDPIRPVERQAKLIAAPLPRPLLPLSSIGNVALSSALANWLLGGRANWPPPPPPPTIGEWSLVNLERKFASKEQRLLCAAGKKFPSS